MATQSYTPLEFLGRLVLEHKGSNLGTTSDVRLKVYLSKPGKYEKTYVSNFYLTPENLILNVNKENMVLIPLKELEEEGSIDAEFNY